mgnify:CR=1 FL=1
MSTWQRERATERPVLTVNVDDFERIDGVNVVDWADY